MLGALSWCGADCAAPAGLVVAEIAGVRRRYWLSGDTTRHGCRPLAGHGYHFTCSACGAQRGRGRPGSHSQVRSRCEECGHFARALSNLAGGSDELGTATLTRVSRFTNASKNGDGGGKSLIVAPIPCKIHKALPARRRVVGGDKGERWDRCALRRARA